MATDTGGAAPNNDVLNSTAPSASATEEIENAASEDQPKEPDSSVLQAAIEARDAAIAEHVATIEQLQKDVSAAKAANYDLLMQTPGEAAKPDPVEKPSTPPGTASLFSKKE